MEEEKKEVKKQDTKPEQKEEVKDVKAAPKKEDKKEEKTEVKKEAKKEETAKTANKKATINQKVENTKTQAKKSNTSIIAVVAIIAIIIVVIAGYMIVTADSPKKAIEAELNRLKAGEELEQVIGDQFDKEVGKLFFDRLGWKVITVKEEGDIATAEVEITNRDFKTIFRNYLQKNLLAAMAGQEISEEDLVKELQDTQVQDITSKQTIKVEKKDGKWQVAEDNDFVTILLPGFNEAINSLN